MGVLTGLEQLLGGLLQQKSAAKPVINPNVKQLLPVIQSDSPLRFGGGAIDPSTNKLFPLKTAPQWQGQPGFGNPVSNPLLLNNGFQSDVPYQSTRLDQQIYKPGTNFIPRGKFVPTIYKPFNEPDNLNRHSL